MIEDWFRRRRLVGRPKFEKVRAIALNSPTAMGHNNFVEPILIFILRINRDHIN